MMFAGFDIAMDQAVDVGFVKCQGDLSHDGRDVAVILRLVGIDEIGQRMPLDVAHRDEMDTLDFANVVDRADIRMGERGGSPASRINRSINRDCSFGLTLGIFSAILRCNCMSSAR